MANLDGFLSSCVKECLDDQDFLNELTISIIPAYIKDIDLESAKLLDQIIHLKNDRTFYEWEDDNYHKIDRLQSDNGQLPVESREISRVFKRLFNKFTRDLALAKGCDDDELLSVLMRLQADDDDFDLEKDFDWWIDKKEEMHDLGLDVPYCPKDMEILAKNIGGFNAMFISLFVAPTGWGKTLFALVTCLRINKDKPTLYINMEMDGYHIFERIYSNKMKKNIRSESPDSIEKIKPDNTFKFSKGQMLTDRQIFAKVVEFARRYEESFIVIDYDQLVKLNCTSQEMAFELPAFAAQLADFAKRYKCHIMVLAQTNESGKLASSKRMQQVFDSIMIVEKKEHDFINIAKSRHGPNGNCVELDMQREIMNFEEIRECTYGQYLEAINESKYEPNQRSGKDRRDRAPKEDADFLRGKKLGTLGIPNEAPGAQN